MCLLVTLSYYVSFILLINFHFSLKSFNSEIGVRKVTLTLGSLLKESFEHFVIV